MTNYKKIFLLLIAMGLQLKILDKKTYFPIIERSYKALGATGVKSGGDNYLIPIKVSGGTCVGSKEYYLTRKVTEGTGFGYGSFIMFGLAYEKLTGLRK